MAGIIKFATEDHLLSFTTGVMNQMRSYVDFEKTPIVNERLITAHMQQVLNDIHPDHLADFKSRMLGSVDVSRQYNSWWFDSFPSLNVAESDLAKTMQAHLSEGKIEWWRRGNFKNWAQFHLSSGVYRNMLLGFTLLIGAFSLGIFSKNNTKDTSTSA